MNLRRAYTAKTCPATARSAILARAAAATGAQSITFTSNTTGNVTLEISSQITGSGSYGINPYIDVDNVQLSWQQVQTTSVSNCTGVEGYRYGFNNQEKDNEVYGEGNSTTAEFWQYDARLGRRWNVDPVVKSYESPYACLGNNPIWFIDLDGADSTLYLNYGSNKELTSEQKTKIKDQVTKSFKKSGLGFLKIVETDLSIYEVNYTESDQYVLFYNNSKTNEYGYTDFVRAGLPSPRYYSNINLSNFLSNSKIKYRKLGLTIAHETTHSFVDRIFNNFKLSLSGLSYYGFTSNTDGHINSTPNLLNDGDVLNKNGRINLEEKSNTKNIERNLEAIYLLIHKYLEIVVNDNLPNGKCVPDLRTSFVKWVKNEFKNKIAKGNLHY